ncbi:hypothetical protein [Acinetobacter phage vB_ApiM_IME-Ap7]|uniref:Uncharacterized protein n=1 Tax=Thermovibrio guaymasensis TaxID=240167 RepID=A0A420W5F1_9BACT|nr:hypothetical protein [Thermovibrio guaymasensis]RKQ59900.1 hypothetical protein C7457_1686 [Thermovibrio guaymasensis]
MILVKALWLAIVDVAKMFKHAPKLLVELFWALAGVLSIILSVVLFPLIVVRKYKVLKNGSPKRVKGKSKGIKVRGNRFA